MGILSKLRTVFRGEIPLYHLPHEALRRRRAASKRRAERASLDALNEAPARLLPEFAKLSSSELLRHFQERKRPSFWPDEIALSGPDKERLINEANGITRDQTWELMGFGVMKFDAANIWRRDPISGHDWGLEYHADLPLTRADGSDVRVLWELNRFGHAITLALAFDVTKDERYAETFFSQVAAWSEQNPYARGANWGCAMEVALRACNWLAAFDIFRKSDSLDEVRLATFLQLLDQHGRFIIDKSEFSYIATSNHYLSDVVGLFWIGTLVPELENAKAWGETGLSEMLREMDKQVLPDGVDFEASTGYHKFVTEMFDASFKLATRNGIEIAPRSHQTLRKMHEFIAAVTRPDGAMPLIGDCDGSSFLSAAGSARSFPNTGSKSEFVKPSAAAGGSASFPHAGIYVLRNDDLYLLFNASDCGLNGRGSHGHNDTLSIEVSAFGRSFIVDPGSYAYNLDLDARHEFRSTRYHSTVMVDEVEQNTIDRNAPFIIGNEASPKVLEWSTNDIQDRVVGEHYGYRRLAQPVTHRRSVRFDKAVRLWIVEDQLTGSGEHQIETSFHIAPEVEVAVSDGLIILAAGDAKLFIIASGEASSASVSDAFFSPAYGKRIPSKIVTWSAGTPLPFRSRFMLVPVGPGEDADERLALAAALADNT